MAVSNQQDTSLATGTLIGLMTPSVVRKAAPYVNKRLMKNLISANRNCTLEEIDAFDKAAETALKENKLDTFGVTLNKVNKFSELSEKDIKAFKEIDKLPLSKEAKFNRKLLVSPTYQAMNGLNANFSFLDKKITYNKELMPATVFHEMGHAKNYTQSFIGKSLQRLSLFTQSYGRNVKAASLISFLTILAPSASEQKDKPMTNTDKTIAAFRKYGALLTMLPFLPTAIEEGMASHKGENMAKKYLSSDLLKRVKKSNRNGFLTYILTPVLWGIGTALGVKAKDNIIKAEIQADKNRLANQPVHNL